MSQRDLRVAVLGAGMAGLLAAIKLRQAGFRQVTVYEKADRIGGTWRDNTYPGLTCDVPSHHYTYSFERNPDWSRYLPAGAEIQAYFEQVVSKYGLNDCIKFEHEANRADFVDGSWQLAFTNGGATHADVVIAATGVLHRPRYPAITGQDDFNGALFHTARWDHSVALDGKRIGVVGTGSTGVQIVSALAGRAAHLEHYQRTAQWVMPVQNYAYTAAQRASFHDPAVLQQAMDFAGYNAAVEAYTQAIMDQASEGARSIAAACLQNLEQSVQDAQLRERLRPDHLPLCKRLIFSPDYYQAIQHPNAHLVTEAITRIEANGIRTADGQLHELDVIALATGFHADTFMRPMTITGRDGVDLESFWAQGPTAYYAITMPDFPNLFMLNGPTAPVGNFSLIDIAEHQWGYIAQLINKLASGEAKQICCSTLAHQRYEQERVAAAKQTVWYVGGCHSWYLDARGIPASWPWTYSRFVQEMAAPRWDELALD